MIKEKTFDSERLLVTGQGDAPIYQLNLQVVNICN